MTHNHMEKWADNLLEQRRLEPEVKITSWNANSSSGMQDFCKLAVFGRSLLGCFSRSGHFWPSLPGQLRQVAGADPGGVDWVSSHPPMGFLKYRLSN